MKKNKKIMLFVNKDKYDAVVEVLNKAKIEFYNEVGVFYFHKLTAVITSVIWILAIIGVALLNK